MTDETSFLALIAAALVVAFLVLWVRGPRGQLPPSAPRPPVDTRNTILIDGSNVIHWQDNTPQLTPLLQVVAEVSLRGLKPGVVFDANVGYKLTGAFMGERDLSRLLSLPRDQILVVPKGKQADPFLLETARDLDARIVTNDRYRDWTESYPDVVKPERLVWGGVQDGRVWLKGLEAEDRAKGGARDGSRDGAL
jgi:Zc3h12a-like Ribonuclease NYN domain